MLTAGQISRRSELARRRLAAEDALRGIVNAYRATVTFDHDQVFEVSHFSEDYASVSGQEEFASAVLARLEGLEERTAQALRSELQALLGHLVLQLAEQRTWLPVERLDPEREAKRRELVLRRILHAGDEPVDGLLPRLLASQNQPREHEALYQQALAALDRMLEGLGGDQRASR